MSEILSYTVTDELHGKRLDAALASFDDSNSRSVLGTLIKDGKVKVHKDCVHTKREFGLYAWDDKSEKDRVIKENDHAMDSIRYFCYTVLRRIDW